MQRAWRTLQIADGRVIGRYRPDQPCSTSASQIDEPDYAPLLDDMLFESGGDIPIQRFIAPRSRWNWPSSSASMKGPGVTLFDVLSAGDWVSPAIEIIDARIEQFDRDTRRRARSSTRSATSPPMPASCWAAAR